MVKFWALLDQRKAKRKSTIPEDAKSANDAPPPYTASATQGAASNVPEKYSPRGPSLAVKPATAAERLRRYLIEIVAFTLSANFDELNSAILGQPVAEHTTLILSDEERDDLLQLSIIAKDLRIRASRNELNTSFLRDREALHDAIIAPKRVLPLAGLLVTEYVIDMISSYADHQCQPTQRQHTLLGYWSQPSAWQCIATLGSHGLLIGEIAPNEEVQHVLGRSLEDYQRKNRLVVPQARYYEPRRSGSEELVEGLSTWRTRR
jgi:hypothetical protein